MRIVETLNEKVENRYEYIDFQITKYFQKFLKIGVKQNSF